MACIRLIVAGSGSALHPRRGQSSVILDLGGHTRLAVDYGCGAPQVGVRAGVEPWDVDLFIITHPHYDHYCGVPHAGFLATFKSSNPRLLMAGSRRAYDAVASIVPFLGSNRRLAVEYLGGGPGASIRFGDAVVSFIEAVHTVEACSVVVEYSGVRVVVSGDTRPTDAFRDAAQDAAAAVHEATYPSSLRWKALENGHSTVLEAVDQVSRAGIGLLYHLTPESEEEAVRVGGAGGRIIVPEDGQVMTLC